MSDKKKDVISRLKKKMQRKKEEKDLKKSLSTEM
jgi:hypothetical protein